MIIEFIDAIIIYKRAPLIAKAKRIKGDCTQMTSILSSTDIYLSKAEFVDWFSLYHNIWSRPESNRYMLWNLTTNEDDAKLRMERTIEYQKTHHAYTIYTMTSRQAIGFAGLAEIEPHIWEDTGIALGSDYTGKGYGKQVLKLLLDSVKSLGGEKFIYSTRAANTASIALALSCGFTYDRSEQKQDPRNGEPYELQYYYKNLPENMPETFDGHK